ncbi:hypothetical protein YZ46_03950, partial [Campylobacter upsaliensis]|nr:hypothetical protein [Campylobacter upsaliensis]EHU6392397.1 hypothetical protein [Campylobacter upsaliensis]
HLLDDIEKILELDLAKQDNENLKLFEKNLSKLQEKIFFLKADEPQEQTLFEITEDNELNNAGDFRSKDCIELLKLADIVVTNPPFSLFREYVAQLVEYGEKKKKESGKELNFVILGNQNAITYKEIFKLIKENKLWLGRTLSYAAFKVPNYYEERSNRFWIDENGQKWRSFGNICWFTNLTHKKRNEILETISSYKKNPEQYPKYDNYDAINVDKTIEIPLDYDGVMGVPITFLDKHNPKQFEILSCHEPAILLETLKQMPKFKEYKSRQIIINGRVCQKTYHRIFIRKIAEVAELRKLEFEKM